MSNRSLNALTDSHLLACSSRLSNSSLEQRFFVEDKYFENGGPVLIQLGGEGPADDVWLREGQIATNYGRDMKAKLILIEHRYYGKSQPTE